MRPQNPIDKWLERHVPPGRFLLGLLVFLFGLMFLIHLIPREWVEPFASVVMGAVCLLAVGGMVEMFWWNIKHPYKPEFCKECKQVLPEKFED